MEKEPRRRAQRVYHDPITYKIGTDAGDIPQSTHDELLVRVADWFREWRSTTEPAADARMRIKCCMNGVTLEGKPWFTHWNSTFATRMRMMCRFDVATMSPIRTGDEKRKAKRERAKEKETARRQAGAAANDRLIPPLVRRELDQRVHYGAKTIPVTENEAELWQKLHEAYCEQFPELRTVNAEAELAMLCDLHVVHERNRLKLIKGERVEPSALVDNARLMADLKKALGIHAEQLAKRRSVERASSVADAAAKFDAMPKELRDKMWLEEMLILFQMYATPSPRDDGGDGYQLDDVGLFGQTRCRTCHCARCGHLNFVGIAIEEIERYLLLNGSLEDVSPVDTLLAKDA